MLISTKSCRGEKSAFTFFDSKLLPTLLGVGQKCLSSMSLYKILGVFFPPNSNYEEAERAYCEKSPNRTFFSKESLANSRKPSVFPGFLKTFCYFCGVFSHTIPDPFTSSFPNVNLKVKKAAAWTYFLIPVVYLDRNFAFNVVLFSSG